MPHDDLVKIESDHYVFLFNKNSLAKKNIKSITNIQESGYNKITNKLDHLFKEKIQYNILKSPYEVGKQYLRLRNEEQRESFRTNAFAWYPNYVYCTYNEDIKSIGCHEVAHLILFDLFKGLGHIFLNEGFSVFMDEFWLGINPDKWTHYLLKEGYIINIDKLLNNNTFYEVESIFSYPIAGSFVKWLIVNEGINAFKGIYQKSIRENIEKELHNRQKNYLNQIQMIKNDDHDKDNIEKILRHFGVKEDS